MIRYGKTDLDRKDTKQERERKNKTDERKGRTSNYLNNAHQKTAVSSFPSNVKVFGDERENLLNFFAQSCAEKVKDICI